MLFQDLCLHCEIARSKHLFCEVCSESFELIKEEGRCTWCFKPSIKTMCRGCFRGDVIAHRVATTFEPFSSANALLKPAYAKLRASLLIYQFMRLDWPMPDMVFPESRATAREVSRMLNVPLRTFGPFYQKQILVITDQIDHTWRYHPLHRRIPKEVRILALIDNR